MRQYRQPAFGRLLRQQGKQHVDIRAGPVRLMKQAEAKTQVIKLVAVDTPALPRNLVERAVDVAFT